MRSPTVAPFLTSPSPRGSAQWVPDRFHPYPRATFPAHRVSAPCSPPDQRTRIPRRLVSKSKQRTVSKRASGSHRRTAAAPRSHGRPGENPSPLCQTWDAATAFRAGVVYSLRHFCCPVIAALLFPDMDQYPAVAAAARRSNVQVIWGTDSLMDQLSEVATGKDCRPSIFELWAPAAFPLGHAAGGGISHSQPLPIDPLKFPSDHPKRNL